MPIIKLAKIFIVFGVLTLMPQNSSIAQESDEVKKGRKVFLRCKICHDIGTSRNSEVGPNLNNIIGRKAGSLETYRNYSKALKEADLIWNEENLNEWFMNPLTFLPGNKMAFSGILREIDRNNLIAFLKENKNTP